jgi:hypothetical protein
MTEDILREKNFANKSSLYYIKKFDIYDDIETDIINK